MATEIVTKATEIVTTRPRNSYAPRFLFSQSFGSVLVFQAASGHWLGVADSHQERSALSLLLLAGCKFPEKRSAGITHRHPTRLTRQKTTLVVSDRCPGSQPTGLSRQW